MYLAGYAHWHGLEVPWPEPALEGQQLRFQPFLSGRIAAAYQWGPFPGRGACGACGAPRMLQGCPAALWQARQGARVPWNRHLLKLRPQPMTASLAGTSSPLRTWYSKPFTDHRTSGQTRPGQTRRPLSYYLTRITGLLTHGPWQPLVDLPALTCSRPQVTRHITVVIDSAPSATPESRTTTKRPLLETTATSRNPMCQSRPLPISSHHLLQQLVVRSSPRPSS
jgi:hypothetical protein